MAGSSCYSVWAAEGKQAAWVFPGLVGDYGRVGG